MNLISNISKTFHSGLVWTTTYIAIALSFILVANENTFHFLLHAKSFYTDIFFSLLSTFGIGLYLKALNIKLDKKYPWYEMFKNRLFKQIILGIIIPLIFVMLLEIIYLKAINISFLESAMLNFEMPLAFIFLIMLNLVSLASYLFKNKHKEPIFINEQVFVYPPKNLEYINVQKGFLEEKIEVANCAYIMSANKLLWLHTFDGEKYRLQGTLEEWQGKLMSSNFYRINRQYLTAYKAIKNVEQTETRKLKVNFVLPTEDVYISKPNAASFRKWWKQ